MPGVPIDGVYVWIGLAIASAAGAGTALAFQPTAPPAPTGLADTVDAASASPTPTVLSEPVEAEAVRIGPRRIAVRSSGGIAAATFAYGPVTPVGDGRLGTVLDGAAPAAVFESVDAFRDALRSARGRPPTWERAGASLRVRSVSWGSVDATLVGV